ncbi:tyrosine-type recombinase/integrase [Nitrolancea hollandica]|uniref:Tyr recombinase domain-containing protein n=1 Tax=Nitrolancea hollandica Lb TaxID=1129897 RepID=I4EF53_9BACT|nr:tyrosine-type recombinase/integrase [Nitrolancea hollandica]CCF83315.1 hypothetical protein NITHO_2210010 [Nitrolancea hollandica Lb]
MTFWISQIERTSEVRHSAFLPLGNSLATAASPPNGRQPITGPFDVRFHDLRHTAATLLLTQGTHPKVVSEMLEHGSIALSLNTYSHLVPALHEQATATMESLFGAAM